MHQGKAIPLTPRLTPAGRSLNRCYEQHSREVGLRLRPVDGLGPGDGRHTRGVPAAWKQWGPEKTFRTREPGCSGWRRNLREDYAKVRSGARDATPRITQTVSLGTALPATTWSGKSSSPSVADGVERAPRTADPDAPVRLRLRRGTRSRAPRSAVTGGSHADGRARQRLAERLASHGDSPRRQSGRDKKAMKHAQPTARRMDGPVLGFLQEQLPSPRGRSPETRAAKQHRRHWSRRQKPTARADPPSCPVHRWPRRFAMLLGHLMDCRAVTHARRSNGAPGAAPSGRPKNQPERLHADGSKSPLFQGIQNHPKGARRRPPDHDPFRRSQRMADQSADTEAQGTGSCRAVSRATANSGRHFCPVRFRMSAAAYNALDRNSHDGACVAAQRRGHCDR